ncbi:hypothetical protein BO86DRAFT_388701 [Aspergillus japonicus CBS 114.51]|uniref:UTP23 sensor motif region domain-containing protein n=2 Tax=Aspergillus TaxID=5052 RepID=A0A2V5IHR7_ASPV1|nr:hypothetical protein BO86DRAFT_388701 [Aspergillus japonicus CBS 114.51]PYI19256.1 hypothetical protein BO99DRAFT_443233 [Aspergillus violaceofuscus CBS 115571]RAH82534.1 hypothetical protein BO86DRAFT_388701 [Aspergillus japonicus CBS 114.51]
MRAKRSKKYRKLMHQYELTFGFREPYQVLVDSNFLRAVHSFKMELIPALERTVQGKVKPLLTKCSLAAIMANQPLHPRTNNPMRPHFLPPPTEVPLRHCSHNEDSTPIDEVECLLSLLSPTTEVKKNKEHYILATADAPAAAEKEKERAAIAAGRKRKRGPDREAETAIQKSRELRQGARAIPGVPIVYVKRSVMVLEPMSGPSEDIRDGVEQGKFRAGLSEEARKKAEAKAAAAASGDTKNNSGKKPGMKKAKGPNPLSMKKPKKRTAEGGAAATAAPQPKRKDADADGTEGGNAAEGGADADADAAAPKAKRRRRHHNKGAKQEDGNEAGESAAAAVPAAGDAMEE